MRIGRKELQRDEVAIARRQKWRGGRMKASDFFSHRRRHATAITTSLVVACWSLLADW